MSRDHARCPFCAGWIAIEATAGYAYAKTRARLHFDACPAVAGRREQAVDLDAVASQIADRVAGAPRPFVVTQRRVGSDRPNEQTEENFDVSTPQQALLAYIARTGARVLGMTERPDGSIGATARCGDEFFRIWVSEQSPMGAATRETTPR